MKGVRDLPALLAVASGLLEAGNAAQAERCLLDGLQAFTVTADVWFLLGAARHRQGSLEGALEAFTECLDIAPSHHGALNARATALSELGRHEEARWVCEKLVRMAPEDPQVRTNLGIILERLGYFEAALAAYNRVLDFAPNFYAARLNRGYVLTRLGRIEEALENNAQLAQDHPGRADAHYNVAEVLLALDRPEEALANCDRALELDPRFAKAHIDRGLALSVIGRLEEARIAFETADRMDPESVRTFKSGFDAGAGVRLEHLDPRLIYLHRQYARQEDCVWSRRDEFIRQFEHLVRAALGKPDEIDDANLPFRSLAFPIDPHVRFALVRSVAGSMESHLASQGTRQYKHHTRSRDKLRVGYVSPDFRTHPAAFLTRRLYGLHDRSRVQVYGYALTPGDGNPVREEIAGSCDRFVDLSHLQTEEAARRIFDDEIDILIDLAGYTNYSRSDIFAFKPAPIQVNFLGYPGSLGADYIDYALVDEVVCPPGCEGLWVEKLAYLPDTYFITNNQQRSSAAPLSRTALGLPDAGFVYCCFNNSYKNEPSIFNVWMNILRRVNGAVLWLLGRGKQLEQSLRREAQARGIDGDRIIFAPFWEHDRHLARFRFADLFLDTLHYNAHTTAIDALWMGVPVITCPGQEMPSRVGASLLSAIGLPELIFRSLREYEEAAVRLALNGRELELLKSELAENRTTHPLFDTEGFVRHLEAAYEIMWSRHTRGFAPETFRAPRMPKPVAVRNRWY
jgi:predicted O-linked N-acetylglucosamine transferase (SPINDLY family)